MALCWDGSPLKSRMELPTLDERPRREERSEDEAYDEARDNEIPIEQRLGGVQGQTAKDAHPAGTEREIPGSSTHGCMNCGSDDVVMVDDSDPSVGYHDEIPWCVQGNHRAD